MSNIECVNCNGAIPADSRFCTLCGTKVDEPNAEHPKISDSQSSEPGGTDDNSAARNEAEPKPSDIGSERPYHPPSSSTVPNWTQPMSTMQFEAARASFSTPPASTGVAYDPGVIQTFADALYARAERIVMIATAIGVVIGLGLGFAIGQAAMSGEAGVPAILGGAVGGFIAYSRAQLKVFMLRLQAQLALCAVQIEQNTSRD